jgi:ATP-binding cassette, subfamily B, bacterial
MASTTTVAGNRALGFRRQMVNVIAMKTKDLEHLPMLDLLRRFAPYYTPDRWRIALSLAFGIAAATLVIAAAWPIRLLIDHVLLGQPAKGALTPVVVGLSPSMAGVALAALAAVLAVAAALASAAEKNLNARLREAMTMRLRVSLLDDVLVRPLSGFAGYRSGELLLRVIDDTGQVARLFCKTAPTILRYAVTLLVSLGTLFVVNTLMGVTGVIIVLMLGALVKLSAKGLQSSSRAKRQTEGKVAGLTQEILRNIRFIRATSGELTTRDAFQSCNRQALSTGVVETQVAVKLERRSQVANALSTFAVTAVAAWLVTQGRLTVGELTLCLAALSQLFKPVEKLNELTSTVTGALTRAERLSKFLPAAVQGWRVAPTPRVEHAVSLQIDGVSFLHAGHEPLLRDINLAIESGESIWIRGPSGAGKSTLVDLLLRLVEPTQGQLVMNGRAANEWDVAQWRSQFAVTLQTPYLFAGSIGDAVRFGNMPLSDSAVWQALDTVGLGDLVRALPRGLEHALSEAGLNLSGGQRAKLSLARALASDRPVLVLDEPLANLDPESQADIMSALRKIRSKRTIVFVSHQLVAAEDFDRVLVLSSGRLRLYAPQLESQPVRAVS